MILFKIFKSLEFILMMLPYSARKGFFELLAKFAYFVDKKHKSVINTNLQIVFGDTLTENEKDVITKYCYKNIVLNLFQVVNKKNLSKEQMEQMITFENEQIILEAKKNVQPIIMITAHYGNWEMMNVGLAKLFDKVNVVYKKLNDSYFDEYLLEAREKFHTKMVEKRGALKVLAVALKNHEPLSLLVDQNTSEKDGIEIEFFGKSARQSAAPAQLARKYNAIIVPVFITTKDDVHYVMSFKEPIIVDHSQDAEADILKATQSQADAMALQIKSEPKFWFWCHKRWKTGNEGLYD